MALADDIKGLSDREAVAYLVSALDDERELVTRLAQHIPAKPMSLRVLAIMISARSRIIDKNHILARLEDDYRLTAHPHALNAHITYLRRGIDEAGLPIKVRNVRGVGYILETPPGWVAPWQKEKA